MRHLRRQEDTRQTRNWTREEAVIQYLAEVKRTLKPATHTDYRNMLGTPKLRRFAGGPVALISRQAMSLAIADVFKRGVERHADHLASVIRPMSKFLQTDNCTRLSGVTERVMLGLEAPWRSRAHATKKEKLTLPMWQVGRLLVIARSGVFHPIIGAALELHNEGRTSGDVTVVHYLYNGTHGVAIDAPVVRLDRATRHT